jgi:PBP1b-binding outer membrane lipoprotein LpoB
MKADAILEMSKEWAGSDVVKFDQAAFDNARRALATLIQVEAGEMAEGHSEANSLSCLLSAVHALMEYNEGEAVEGEVMLMPEMEMADKPEKTMAEEEETCPECEKSMKECACETGKCLECGCHEPANNHGNPDVTTAVVVSDKSQVSDIKTMVEDIVKELLTNPSVGEEITTKAADSDRIEALESELAQVKSLAAPSGPKRFAAVSNTTANVNKTKAAIYRAKAATTLDKSLANGYLALAIDLEKSESQ